MQTSLMVGAFEGTYQVCAKNVQSLEDPTCVQCVLSSGVVGVVLVCLPNFGKLVFEILFLRVFSNFSFSSRSWRTAFQI